jgi:hypothetical protein
MGQDLERAKQRLSQFKEGGRKKTPYWKATPGENKIRILPPVKEGTDFFREYLEVWKLGPNKRKVIPRKQFGFDDCPYEAYYAQLMKRGDEASKRELDEIRAKGTVAVWIIDRKDEAKGPQLWTTSGKQLRSLLAFMTDPDYGDITLPMPDEDGKGAKDVTLTYDPSAKDKRETYSVRVRPVSSPLGNADQIQQWLSADLFEEYNVGAVSSAEYIQAVLDGTEASFSKGEGARDESEPAKPAGNTAVSMPQGFSSDTELWIAVGANVQKTTAAQIVSHVMDGGDPNVQTLDGTSGWVKASALGFKKIEPVAPPPPSAPMAPAAPPPPPSAPLPPSEADVIAQQAAALAESSDVSFESDAAALEAQLRQMAGKK